MWVIGEEIEEKDNWIAKVDFYTALKLGCENVNINKEDIPVFVRTEYWWNGDGINWPVKLENKLILSLSYNSCK